MSNIALPANFGGKTPTIDPAIRLPIESYSKAREVESKHETLDSMRK